MAGQAGLVGQSWSQVEVAVLIVAVVVLESKKGAYRLVHIIYPHRSLDAIKSKVDVVFASHSIHTPH